jgi:membrane-bound acyltransferase YfiQ involved in biofilm formation
MAAYVKLCIFYFRFPMAAYVKLCIFFPMAAYGGLNWDFFLVFVHRYLLKLIISLKIGQLCL